MNKFAVIGAIVWSGTCFGDPYYEVASVGIGDVFALGINDRFEVVGYVGPPFNLYAFLWSEDNGLISLGGYSAYDINEAGQVAGQFGPARAAVWEAGTWIILPDRQDAQAINDLGQVTGLISAQQLGPYAPYRDDDIHDAAFIELLRPFDRASHGYDINNHGEVVADCGTLGPTFLYVGVFYRPDASLIVLDNDGNYDTHPRSLNDHRMIVGESCISESECYAVFWDSPESTLEYMGSLGIGTSRALSVNNFGHAVGYSSGRAFLWIGDKGMSDLNSAINPEVGLTLTAATGINDHGAIIAWGIDSDGQQGSFLLKPPTGACCDGSACAEIPEFACSYSGGTFLGLEGTCDIPDTDGDGVGQCDRCPEDGKKVEPGICGCGVTEADSDGDGVLDCLDECPGLDDAVFAPDCIEAIPTVSTWGLVIVALALMAGGKVVFGTPVAGHESNEER